MARILNAAAAALAALALILGRPAAAQDFPGSAISTLQLVAPPTFTVSGSPTVGPAPVITLSFANENANVVLAGPATGSPAAPSWRALVGADLPFPTASTLGGIQSLSATAHQFANGISTFGVLQTAQPAFSDLSGQATLAQLPSLSANQIYAALSAGTPTGINVPSCADSNGNHLNWNSGSGLVCGTSTNGSATQAITVGATQTGNYTVQSTDAFTIIPVSATAPTITMPQSTGGFFPPGSWVMVTNSFVGTGTGNNNVTVHIDPAAPTATFDGIPTYNGDTKTFFLSPQMTARITAEANNHYFVQMMGVSPGVDVQSGTSVQLNIYDCAQFVQFTSASAVTVTAPTTLPKGCVINMTRTGAGQVFFSQVATPSGGFTVNSLNAQAHDGGQYSAFSLLILPGGASGLLTGQLSP